MRAGFIAFALLVTTVGCFHRAEDEGRIVFQSDRSGEWAMYSVRPDSSDLALVPSEPNGYYAGFAYWSRGGERLFVPIERASRGQGIVIDMRRGARTRVGVHALGGAAWSPDAGRLAVAGESGIVVVDADGSNRRQVTRDPHDSEPAWSPDGERIAFVSGPDLYTVGVDGGPPDRVLHVAGDNEVFRPLWSPEGRWLAFSAVDYDVSAAVLEIVRPDGTERRRLARDAEEAAWSPRAQTLLYVHASDIYRVDADGANRRRLTSDGPGRLFDRSPVWSPDGEQIAYVAPRLARGIRDPRMPTDIWVMEADGSKKHAVTRAFPTGGSSMAPDWVNGEPNATPVNVPAGLVTFATPYVLRTRQPVGGLAAEGSLAVVEQGLGSATEFENPPGPLLVWDFGRGRVSRIPVRGCGTASNPVLAGRRIAYHCDNSAIDVIARSFRVSSAGRTETIVRARATHLVGVPFKSRLLHGVTGSGSSVLFGVADASIPVVGRWRTDRTHIWRLDGARRHKIATFEGDAWIADADATRVGLLQGRRAVVVLSRDGERVRRLPFGRNRVLDAALDGRHVIVLERGRLTSYDIEGGRQERSWPVADGGPEQRIEAVNGGLVAYVSGVAIHVLRPSDGRDVVVRLPRHAAEPVFAALTGAGLFYSYTDSRDVPAGRVVFVPRSDVISAFGPASD